MSVTIEMFSKLNQTLEDDVKIHILHMRSSIYFYIKTGLVIFFIVAICDEIQMKLQKNITIQVDFWCLFNYC